MEGVIISGTFSFRTYEFRRGSVVWTFCLTEGESASQRRIPTTTNYPIYVKRWSAGILPPGRQGCLRSHAPQTSRELLVVNILLHEKGIENGELALVVLDH